jgi:phosphoglycolate phosphatase
MISDLLLEGAAVVFDLDGTIADTAPDLVRATNQALASAGYPHATETVIRPAVAYGARAMVAEALKSLGRTPDEQEVADLAERMVMHYDADIAAASAFYPGFEETLDRLAAAGVRLGVCTNKREVLARKLLAELGVLGRFQALAGGDTFPFRKPDPRHLLTVIEALGATPGRSVMVGDTEADAGAARGAGVFCVAVTFGYSPVPAASLGADAVISHFNQLESVLRDFLAR